MQTSLELIITIFLFQSEITGMYHSQSALQLLTLFIVSSTSFYGVHYLSILPSGDCVCFYVLLEDC